MNLEQSERHFAEHGETILGKILAGTYVPGAIRPKAIPKPQGGERVLGIPNVTDRVIQQAVHQIISPLWESDFSDIDSQPPHGYSPLRGRSLRSCPKHLQAFGVFATATDRDGVRMMR